MNDFNLINFLSATGFFTLVYFVARLLNNWFNFRRERYSDEEDHLIANLFTIVLFFIFGILYLISFPITTISYFIHTSTVKMAIEADRKEAHEKEEEIRKIYEKIAYNNGYKEGRADGWFACAEHNSSPKAFDEGRKVGYNHGVQKGYEQGWSNGYDSGYEIAETHKFEEIDVSEYENNKHLKLINSYTGEPLNNQYDYIKYITRKNKKIT